MHKPSNAPGLLCAGCDTSKDTIDVVRRTAEAHTAHRRFNNTPAGHQRLIQWLGKTGAPVRVVVEASGASPFKVFSHCGRYTEARYSAGKSYLLKMTHGRIIAPP